MPLLLRGQLSRQHEHQRTYFDAQFAGFDGYRVDAWRASFNRRIFEALGLPDSGPYLDVGVGGSGATVIEAARAGAEAVGCDLSLEGVLRAAAFAAGEGVADRTTFVVCDAERLPFGDESFGAASAVAVLEHLTDDGAAASELARVLRPGGRLWVTVPHAYRNIPLPLWPVYWLHDRRLGHMRHYGTSHLRSLLEPHGLQHVRSEFTGHPVKVLQYALTLAGERSGRDISRIWWAMEERDLRARHRPRWALQLSQVFTKE